MKNNERGAVEVAVVVAIAAGCLILGLIAPKLNPLGSLFQRDAANKKASWTRQIEKTKPVLLNDEKGRPVAIGTEIQRVYDTGKEDGTPAPTIGERIGGFFAGLTGWGLAFVGVSLAFFGGAPLVWVARKYFVMKQALKNTVVAIRDADNDTYEKLKPKLAAAHDKQDRKVIDKIKTELN